MDKDQNVFVASSELTKKIQKLKDELELDSPGEVLSLALSLLELSLGRKIELSDDSKTYRIEKFAKNNQTVILDD